MADRDEKIFPALPQKRQRARDQGQLARSRDLTGAIAFAGVAVLAPVLFPVVGRHWLLFFRAALRASSPADQDLGLIDAGLWPLAITTAACGAIALFATAGAVVQGGMVFSVSRIGFDCKRLSPFGYFQRILSATGGLELLKAALKIGAVAAIAWSIARNALLTLTTDPSVPAQLETLAGAATRLLGICAAIGLFTAAADYAHKLYQHESDLRMTRQEFLDELKQEQGNPQIKRALRIARRRLFRRSGRIHQAAAATVVLTNPTHYAVALRYRRGFDRAPLVVAKGAGENAFRIISVARLAAVPVMENKLLARALFRSVEVGDQIPRQLYRAVAEVLATIMRAEAQRRREQPRKN